MTTTTSNRTDMPVEIVRVAQVDGRNGPQWEVHATPPWVTKYPIRGWIEIADHPEKPALGPARVIVEQGPLSKPDYDGQQPWMYRQRIVSFAPSSTTTIGNGSAEAPYQPAPASAAPATYEDAETRKQSSIHSQVALKVAVSYAISAFSEAGGIPEVDEVLHYATSFYGWLQNPTDAPQDARTALSTPSADDEPSGSNQSPANEPELVRAFDSVGSLLNAAKDELGYPSAAAIYGALGLQGPTQLTEMGYEEAWAKLKSDTAETAAMTVVL